MISLATTQFHRGLTVVRRIYFARMIVLSLGFICGGAVLYQLHVALHVWVLAVIHCVLWPHIAYQIESRAQQPNRIAMYTLLLDNIFVGAWVPVFQFNLLPSVTIMAMTAMSNVGIGGLRLLLRGTAAQAVGIGIGVLLAGFHWQPVSTHFNVLASLPIIVLYPIAIGALTYQLSMRLSLQRDRLEHVSKHDGLSGLLNRMHWESLVAEEFSRGQRQRTSAAIILADIDYFKAVNDSGGHAAGDEVIRQFADLLRANVREIDRAARYGGEEFAILLPDTTLAEAIDAAERLRTILENHPLGDVRVTASYGVAVLTEEFADFSAWVQCADAALYRAKAAGRNRVIAYDSIVRTHNT
jgi:diguanylate cyclase